jgi:GntR family transcriptional regulator/MocR family aminotransferase
MQTRTSGITLDPASDVPLHRQLTAAFRDAILRGTLGAGERLPSSRELQTRFGISRNTALTALSQLHAEGYLVTVPGSGTYVAALQGSLKTRRIDESEVEWTPTRAAAAFLSARSVLEPSGTLAVRLNGATAFRPGIPAIDCFPASQFKRSINKLGWTQELLDYPRSWTNERLKHAIVARLQQTRGIVCSPDQVLIVSSTQYAVSLIARVLLRPRDAVVMEDPGFPTIRAVFLALGARIVTAPVDDEGVDVASFANRRASLAFVTPSHQYPTGAVLSLDRRIALLNWASERNAWVIEDDYDSEFNYTGLSHPALQGLDEGQRVVYLGTFSKALSPALRIAYIVAPRPLRKALKGAHHATGGYASPILQSALASFMERGHFARHIARMRKIYDERRHFLHSALTDAGVSVRDSGAGLHFIADIPANLRDAQVSERAAARGVVAPPVSGYFYGRPTLNGLVVGFAATPIAAAKTSLSTLLKAF